MKPVHKRIRIPQPTLVLHGSGVALACGFNAELQSDRMHGLFAGDTRVLSSYRILIAGQSWTLLSWERDASATAVFTFQNPKLTDIHGDVEEGVLSLQLRRRVQGGMHDHFRLKNYGSHSRLFRLTILIDADFSDIFKVHDKTVVPHLSIQRIPHARGIHFLYEKKGFRRGLYVNTESSGVDPQYVGSTIVFDLNLESHSNWECCLEALPEIGDTRKTFIGKPHEPEPDPVPRNERVSIETASILKGAFDRGQADLHALAVPQKEGPPYLAAGVPWFLTLFGRDSLLTSLMMGIDGVWAAEGALKALSDKQATTRDDWRDAEPGKFPHEIRVGELAHFGKIPHSAYYGTHDAQALYCLNLWNAWRWTGRRDLLDSYFGAATKAMEWCEKLGDRDGDGFLEYKTRSPQGYYNQSWKDAGDAIVDEEGELAPLPLATVELQGYFFAAKLAMAELYTEMGNEEEATRLTKSAFLLRDLVEERYWMEEKAFYALALDGKKDLVRTISSNPGHLLWCGLVSSERAKLVAERMLQSDLCSGWGLRTLSSEHPAYNPLSYQRGSVWPHDTILSVSGLRRYGLYDAADLLLKSLLEAASLFDQQRFPELFCGMERSDGGPTPYVSANIPQAWAAAVSLLAVQLILGVVPDAPQNRCYLSPRLPSWLDHLDVQDLSVGERLIQIKLVRNVENTVIDHLESGGVDVVIQQPKAPLWGAIC